jgi:hypothetical protein
MGRLSPTATPLTVAHNEPKLEISSMMDIRYLPFAGRLFIGLPFMVSGLRKLAAYRVTIALIESSKPSRSTVRDRTDRSS